MHRKLLNRSIALVMLLAATTSTSFAQGEDSTTAARDLLVINAMLPGIYANANQSYFDGRGDRETKHKPLFVDVRSVDVSSAGDRVVTATGYFNNDPEQALDPMLWSLSEDPSSNTVRMRIWQVTDTELGMLTSISFDAEGRSYCDVFWRRESGQFRATSNGGCDAFASAFQLSETALWINYEN